MEREEDDQFVGLLVKNLENIQGDERDIIILSVCYGPARDGKVRMNFGPINLSGGHKRLNVAFSRARCHMALVSSMHSADITNDYNEGANCLKNYLRYAEAASIGDGERTSQILRTLSQLRAATDNAAQTNDAVVEQLQLALRERGYRVDCEVGQSHFRCDLAIARADDPLYRLGILVDTSAWYAQRDLVERELLKPDLFDAFGWRIHVVLARDWYCDEPGVLEQIERLLAGDDLEESAEDDELLPAEVPAARDVAASVILPPAVSAEAGSDSAVPGAPVEAVRENSGKVEGADATDADFAATTAAGAPAVSTAREWSQYLEYVSGGSSKFWQISVSGSEQTVRFGRIGSRGQTLTKSFDDHDSALADAQRQAEGKRRKGYREKNGAE